MKHTYKIIIVLSTLLLITLIALPIHVSASGGCLPINNGGATTQQFCPSPTPVQAMPFQTQNTTANGQPIYPSSRASSTPNTGPESWVLPSLALLGGIGFFVRRKATS